MSEAWPFGDLMPRAYRAILCDPPWRFNTFSAKGEGKSAQGHYACMPLDQIKALPVAELAHPDGCALIMWATAPMLPEAMQTMAAWGFTYKSAGAWAKRSRTGTKWAFGTGYCFRSAVEFYLLGTRGRPKQQVRNVRNLIVANLREHSRKPDQMHHDVAALFPEPRAELFAREARPGFDTWGNESNRFTHQETML